VLSGTPSNREKRPGSMPGQGPPLPGGMLRSAAELHGHQAVFMAMYALTISRSASQWRVAHPSERGISGQ
jgi:hypothetical protein